MIKKIILTFITIFTLSFSIVGFGSNAQPIVDGLDPSKNEKIISVSYDAMVDDTKDFQGDIESIWWSYLGVAKGVLQGLMLIFLVYAGFMFFYGSIGVEDKLDKAKNQIYYSLLGLLFLNVPGVLYSLFGGGGEKNIDTAINTAGFNSSIESGGNFLLTGNFQLFIENNLLGLLEIVVGIVATFSLLISAFNIINSDGKDDIITEEKDKIVYSITALIFVGYIEVFKDAIFTGNQDSVQNLFSSVINLAIFIGGPIALSFIVLAGYYLITSNGEEERLTKAKNIIINSIFGVLILMASWAFLADINF